MYCTLARGLGSCLSEEPDEVHLVSFAALCAGAVLDELYFAVKEGRPVIHDGRWAKATMEVCLAMLQSAREQRELPLCHQIPTRDPGA